MKACADCHRTDVDLVNDACKPCLQQRRLVFCERGMIESITDEQREVWAGHYRRIEAAS